MKLNIYKPASAIKKQKGLPMRNSHTTSFIEYYLNLKSEPYFAIMLKGAWGTGKTWFIENVIKDYSDKNIKFKYIKVSLYGMTSIKQIEEEFFRQLHPVLSSKAYILGANILKGALKATVKVDLDHNGSNETTFNAQIPDINIKDFARTPEDFVLIFDDIERSSISLKDLFGYINHFVEVNGYKAILIANEEEILKSNNVPSKEDYIRFKEKLIGKTFDIESDFESACNEFMKEITHMTIRDTIKDDLKSISNIYCDAGYNNLRHVRQFFLDFDRACLNLDTKHIENAEFLKTFCHQLMIFSIEYRAGSLTRDDFTEIGKDTFQFLTNPEKPKSEYQKIKSKHSTLSLSETLLTGEQWRDIICDGKIGRETLAEALNSSKFFLSLNSAPWEFLWNWYTLDEDTLFEKHAETKKYLAETKFSHLGEILMISSILFNLIDKNITNDDIDEIEKISYAKIIEYYNGMSSYEVIKTKNDIIYNDFSSYRGLGYLNTEGKNFKNLISTVKSIQQSRAAEALPDLANEFINQIRKGDTSLLSELSATNSNELNIYQKEFLSYIKPETFMECYINMNPNMRLKINSRMKARYGNELFRSSLTSEKEWLESLNTLAENFITNSESKFDKYHIDIFRQYIVGYSLELFTSDDTPSDPSH
ncbi:P-loop NTPase fold protein [Pantoea sp. EA-12]|uniref:P-loop NTPase fold protein n=1 Tax=Pantoea sp. EA-12 TaxID=3043303 RepID=UPI0024B512E7|nr:P-loop NTPase fold protein [Pantoea sp. EA-12]MDI9221357.1 P-loop NTPase fold protein [Pantoea sp. EA-12]